MRANEQSWPVIGVKRRKPTRRDLLVVIGRLQDLIGRASSHAGNDRSPNRLANTQGTLDEAVQLCVEARCYDPPIKDSGPWAGVPGPAKTYV